MRRPFRFRLICLGMVLPFLIAGCAGSGGGTSTGNGDLAILSISPGDINGGSVLIGGSQIITIVFNGSVGEGISLEGSMGLEWDRNWDWRRTNKTKDTLVINPRSEWSEMEHTFILSGGGLPNPVTIKYSVRSSMPSYTVNPNSPDIMQTDIIKITFDVSMSSTVRLGGSMYAESIALWETSANTILVIKPKDKWTMGDGRTLVISCSDTIGHQLNFILTYNVKSNQANYIAVPPSGCSTLLGGTHSIALDFKRTMDINTVTASITLDDNIYSNIDPVTWDAANQVLTIKPKLNTEWDEGSYTIVINGKDTVGNTISTITLNYCVNKLQPQIDSVFVGDSNTINVAKSSSIIMPANKMIRIFFNKKMNVTPGSSFKLGGTLSQSAVSQWVSPDNKELRLTPASGTWPDGTFNLTIDCRDEINTPIAQFFQTITVDGTVPTYGLNPDLNVSTVKLGANTPIYIEFSKEMDVKSLSQITTKTNGSLTGISWPPTFYKSTRGYNNGLLKIVPNGPWGADGASGTIQITVKDLAGNPTFPNATIIFNVIVDRVQPKVTAINFNCLDGSPVLGAVDRDGDGKKWISGKKAIRLTFSEEIQSGSYWAYDAIVDGKQLWSGFYTGQPSNSSLVLDTGTTDSFFNSQVISSVTLDGTKKILTITPSGTWTTTPGVKKIKLYVMDMARNESNIDLFNPDGVPLTYGVDADIPTLKIFPDSGFGSPSITTEINTSQEILLQFSKPMDRFTCNGDFGTSPVAQSLVKYVLKPAPFWQKNINRALQITGGWDKVGNMMSDANETYHVKPMPVAVPTPVLGAVVDFQQPIYLKFKHPMNPASLKVSYNDNFSTNLIGSAVNADWTAHNVFANDVVKLVPATPWTGASIYVTCNEATPYSGTVTVKLDYNFQTTGFTYTVWPPAGSLIDDNTNVNIIFTAAMNNSQIPDFSTGNIGAVNASSPWIDAYQLHVAPTTTWTAGDSRTLTIKNLQKMTTAPIEDIKLSYIAYNGNLYADGTNGDDEDPGTTLYPKKTIQDAVDLAGGVYAGSTASVNVAQGTYTGNPVFTMNKEGISVYGGFQHTTWSRNTATYSTNLYGTSDGLKGAVEVDGTAGALNQTTVLDGFYMYAVKANNARAMYLHNGASITINNCYLYGVDPGNSNDSNFTKYAIYADGSSPKISNCKVNSDTTKGVNDDATSYGIYINNPLAAGMTISNCEIIGGTRDSSAGGNDNRCKYYGINIDISTAATIRINNNKICGAYKSDNNAGTNESYGLKVNNPGSAVLTMYVYNNLIHGGDTYDGSNSYSYGIHLKQAGGNIFIQNNSIYSKGDYGTYGIYLKDGSTPWIQNNLLLVEDDQSGYSFCIYEADSGLIDNPQCVRNNVFYVPNDLTTKNIYQDENATSIRGSMIDDDGTLVSTAEGSYKLSSWGNHYLDPNISPANYIFTSANFLNPGTTDPNLTQGAINGQIASWSWTSFVDYNNAPRNNPWSIGAYEK